MPSARPNSRSSYRLLRVDGWLLDPGTSLAKQGDLVVHIRPQLMDIVTHLVEHAGRTVPKEELLDVIWPDKYIVEAGVTRCVSELRQLLGDDPKEPRIIQTVPKRGYRLVAEAGFVSDGDVEAPPGRNAGPSSVNQTSASGDDQPPPADNGTCRTTDGSALGRWWRSRRVSGLVAG